MSINHYENFPVASLLLPRRLRGAVTDLYRFSRSADDIADEGNASDAERLAQLAAFRHALHDIGSKPNIPSLPPSLAPIFVPLAATITRHQLPLAPFYDLLSAFEQDISVKRYEDYLSLLNYCARSANPVGRLMLHLFETVDTRSIAESDAICTGLQLVNFWQDVRIDWHKQRVYLPQEDLRRHHVNETDIAAARLSPAWRALMDFQIQRTRALLHFGAPLTHRLPGRVGLELRLIVQGGLRILECIERRDYDVFMHRPTLKGKDWAIMLWRALTSKS